MLQFAAADSFPMEPPNFAMYTACSTHTLPIPSARNKIKTFMEAKEKSKAAENFYAKANNPYKRTAKSAKTTHIHIYWICCNWNWFYNCPPKKGSRDATHAIVQLYIAFCQPLYQAETTYYSILGVLHAVNEVPVYIYIYIYMAGMRYNRNMRLPHIDLQLFISFDARADLPCIKQFTSWLPCSGHWLFFFPAANYRFPDAGGRAPPWGERRGGEGEKAKTSSGPAAGPLIIST